MRAGGSQSETRASSSSIARTGKSVTATASAAIPVRRATESTKPRGSRFLPMTFLAAFIGVDRHQDLRIRELGGARRDATALWALFTDTIPNLSATLLVDEHASINAIRRAM